jgi:hypothetical protein
MLAIGVVEIVIDTGFSRWQTRPEFVGKNLPAQLFGFQYFALCDRQRNIECVLLGIALLCDAPL